MTAGKGPLRPSLEEARELARLQRRVADLQQQLDDMRDQRDAARRTVAQQQREYVAVRPRQLHHPRPVVRDVPTGGQL